MVKLLWSLSKDRWSEVNTFKMVFQGFEPWFFWLVVIIFLFYIQRLTPELLGWALVSYAWNVIFHIYSLFWYDNSVCLAQRTTQFAVVSDSTDAFFTQQKSVVCFSKYEVKSVWKCAPPSWHMEAFSVMLVLNAYFFLTKSMYLIYLLITNVFYLTAFWMSLII